ncbi:MAG TPA: CDP-diacylglycerol--serine O-phosphatidyltransferase [Candidatus Binataceae bacterium]|nr:CDP-diacylglycerol--serine O-phosphatidyltransferase [Candidatus Binataceae bacterium]
MVPATITSMGLLAGFYSLISSIGAHFEMAALMILVAFVCDSLDGRVARASHSSSQFGVEYDSLSDVVAFGVAPAALVYTWALRPLGVAGAVISGLFVVAAALRLARFNIQTASADKRRFTGLPVPGAAVMITGLVLAYSYFELNSPRMLATVMAPVLATLAALMVSRVPYPSFKAINLRKRAQFEVMAGVLVIAAMLLAMPQFTAFVIAAAYVLSGPFLYLRGERIRPVTTGTPAGADEEIFEAMHANDHSRKE